MKIRTAMILSILAKSLYAQVVVDPLLDNYPPLQRINIYHPTGVSVEISDGHHNRYHVGPLDGSSIALGGALGYHKLEIMDKKGKVIESKTIRVDGKTTLYESVGVYRELMDVLYWTMRSWGRDKDIVRINGEYYEFFRAVAAGSCAYAQGNEVLRTQLGKWNRSLCGSSAQRWHDLGQRI